jgi:hypothetical protein
MRSPSRVIQNLEAGFRVHVGHSVWRESCAGSICMFDAIQYFRTSGCLAGRDEFLQALVIPEPVPIMEGIKGTVPVNGTLARAQESPKERSFLRAGHLGIFPANALPWWKSGKVGLLVDSGQIHGWRRFVLPKAKGRQPSRMAKRGHTLGVERLPCIPAIPPARVRSLPPPHVPQALVTCTLCCPQCPGPLRDRLQILGTGVAQIRTLPQTRSAGSAVFPVSARSVRVAKRKHLQLPPRKRRKMAQAST